MALPLTDEFHNVAYLQWVRWNLGLVLTVFFFFKDLFKDLKARVSDVQRDLPFTGSFPCGCNGQGWAKPKFRAGSFIQVTHIGSGDPNTREPSFAAFPWQLEQRWSSWDLNWFPNRMLVLRRVALPAGSQGTRDLGGFCEGAECGRRCEWHKPTGTAECAEPDVSPTPGACCFSVYCKIKLKAA